MGIRAPEKFNDQLQQLLKEFFDEPIKTLERFQRVHQLHPEDATTLYYWGAALAELGRYVEAIEKLKLAHQLQSEDPRPLYVWGAALAELGRISEAQEKFERADELLMSG